MRIRPPAPRSFVVAIGLLGCGGRTALEATSSSAPPVDAGVAPDAPPAFEAGLESGAACDAGGPLERAYVFDDLGVLYRYEPATSTYQALGSPGCESAVAWTLTVSRRNAYILYTDWTLFAVDLETLACTRTPFQNGQLGLDSEYGIAVSSSRGVERLFVYGLPTGSSSPILAASDLTSFALTKVGDVTGSATPAPFPVNLTADAYGDLYAYSPTGLLLEIDAGSGAVVDEAQTGLTAGTWATLTYGRSLFLFADARVVGYDLPARRTTFARDLGIAAIGAGSFLVCP